MDDAHRHFGVELNNETWRVLAAGGPGDGATDEEREEFLYGAYASLYHWTQTPTATIANRARGEHLVSRAATAVGRFELGMRHANRCLELCEADPEAVEDWDLAFAHEAIARAAAGAGDMETARRHHRTARTLGAAIAEQGDRDVFIEEFRRAPWFGFTG